MKKLRSRESSKLQMKATEIYKRSVRDGELVSPKVCSKCGTSGRIHGHHNDYTKPLEVEWLCTSCHMRAHPLKLRHDLVVKRRRVYPDVVVNFYLKECV